MRELVVILSDFYSPSAAQRAAVREAASLEAVPGAARALPRLPALETLLGRGQRERLPQGWRAWLAQHIGAAVRAPATIVAQAAQLPLAEHHYWLATPVHWVAGVDTVRLHPAGLLQLSDAQQQQFVRDFAAAFAGSPWQLHALGQRELLLAGPRLWASGADPARCLGADPSAGLPVGPDATALKRLGSELELWLHAHPLNEARVRSGELPVTTLWLWGAALEAAEAAPSTASATPRPLPRLYGSDSYAEALWRLQAGSSRPMPADFAAAEGEPAAAEQLLLCRLGEPAGLASALQRLEHDWLAQAARALRARRLRALQLLAGEGAYRLRWRDLGRVWRSRAPWWERL